MPCDRFSADAVGRQTKPGSGAQGLCCKAPRSIHVEQRGRNSADNPFMIDPVRAERNIRPEKPGRALLPSREKADFWLWARDMTGRHQHTDCGGKWLLRCACPPGATQNRIFESYRIQDRPRHERGAVRSWWRRPHRTPPVKEVQSCVTVRPPWINPCKLWSYCKEIHTYGGTMQIEFLGS